MFGEAGIFIYFKIISIFYIFHVIFKEFVKMFLLHFFITVESKFLQYLYFIMCSAFLHKVVLFNVIMKQRIFNEN